MQRRCFRLKPSILLKDNNNLLLAEDLRKRRIGVDTFDIEIMTEKEDSCVPALHRKSFDKESPNASNLHLKKEQLLEYSIFYHKG